MSYVLYLLWDKIYFRFFRANGAHLKGNTTALKGEGEKGKTGRGTAVFVKGRGWGVAMCLLSLFKLPRACFVTHFRGQRPFDVEN